MFALVVHKKKKKSRIYEWTYLTEKSIFSIHALEASSFHITLVCNIGTQLAFMLCTYIVAEISIIKRLTRNVFLSFITHLPSGHNQPSTKFQAERAASLSLRAYIYGKKSVAHQPLSNSLMHSECCL